MFMMSLHLIFLKATLLQFIFATFAAFALSITLFLLFLFRSVSRFSVLLRCASDCARLWLQAESVAAAEGRGRLESFKV